MAPEEHSKSLETDEFIYPDQVLEAMGKGLKLSFYWSSNLFSSFNPQQSTLYSVASSVTRVKLKIWSWSPIQCQKMI